jgi:hypothetical protein
MMFHFIKTSLFAPEFSAGVFLCSLIRHARK